MGGLAAGAAEVADGGAGLLDAAAGAAAEGPAAGVDFLEGLLDSGGCPDPAVGSPCLSTSCPGCCVPCCVGPCAWDAVAPEASACLLPGDVLAGSTAVLLLLALPFTAAAGMLEEGMAVGPSPLPRLCDSPTPARGPSAVAGAGAASKGVAGLAASIIAAPARRRLLSSAASSPHARAGRWPSDPCKQGIMQWRVMRNEPSLSLDVRRCCLRHSLLASTQRW